MVAITTRTAKGSPLTIAEMDANLTALKAAVEAAATALAGKADVGQQQAASTISDFLEAVQDAVGAMVAAAGGTYNDGAGTITLPSGGSGAVSSVAGRTGAVTLASADLSDFLEAVQDAIGAMVAAAGGTYNDAAGTITLPSGGGGAVASVAGRTGAVVLSSTDLSDFVEAAQDVIGALVTAAGGAYNDAAGTITFDGKYAPLSAVTAPVSQFEVTASNTLALVQATHQCATITLSGTGATFSASATTLGNGFACTIKNRTGADFTVPTFTGATREYAKAAAHTKIASGSDAAIEVYTRNGAMYVSVMGDTL